ncbi:hypothetical protein [Consotaella salsifontis]|uniref:hypothetical protein n=1 Tax=Consotaella salsifontis TaxID=1365950 RepID=UPI000999EFBC|nr:hypothetical protein [Consotaella salsifontis]
MAIRTPHQFVIEREDPQGDEWVASFDRFVVARDALPLAAKHYPGESLILRHGARIVMRACERAGE